MAPESNFIGRNQSREEKLARSSEEMTNQNLKIVRIKIKQKKIR